MVTTRKIRRNFFRWFFRPFWRSKPKVAWQPPSRIPKVDRTLSQLDRYYLKANGGYLMPIIPDVGQYVDLFPAGTADSCHDLIALAFGTPSQLLTHFYDFITYQKPDTDNTALLLSGTTTPGDADALASRAREQAYWVRKSQQKGKNLWVYLDNPPNFRFITDEIGNIASTGGNGADQLTALQNLQTDAFTIPDILRVLKEGHRSFLDYKPNGCALFTAEGGGGTGPYLRYAVPVLKDALPVNRHYILYLLPTDDEPLHVPNMKGTLAYELKREAHERATSNETRKRKLSTLHFLFKQETAGAHKTDRAMIAGIITLTGVSRARHNGSVDPTTKFNLIKEIAGTWLTVNPKVVPLSLIPMGKVEMVNGYRHEEHFKVNLPEDLGGQRINPIVMAIESMVAEDRAAPHFITVCSYLDENEMTYIAEGVRRFPLLPGGRVQVFFNPCLPAFNANDDTAEALLCDFRGGKGVRQLLHAFLVDKQATPLTNGFSWTEQLALAGMVAEGSQTEEIEAAVLDLAKTATLKD